MNIFILDSDQQKSAEAYVDSHVIKIILELGQMLSTAHWVLDGEEDTLYPNIIYKKTHPNHPCSVWVRETRANYQWAFEMFRLLSKEYAFRYEKQHQTWMKLSGILMNPPQNISPHNDDDSSVTITPFAQAMPEEYRDPLSPVNAYRSYYLGEKRNLFSWKKRNAPEWIYTHGLSFFGST